jgi:protein TonB
MRWRDLSTLQWALLFSGALHAAVLTVRFVDPEGFNRVFNDTPLEVILVNARSKEAPTQAQAIAQANLAGGGEAEKGRATSPLPSAATMQLGDAADDARRRIDRLQHEQQQLLAQIRRDLAALPPPDPQRENGTPQEREQEDRRKQLLRLLAEIEKRVNDETRGPRSATSARPHAKRSTRCTTTACAAASKSAARAISRNGAAASSTAS